MKTKLQKVAPVASFVPYDLKFVDDVELNIQSVPEGAFLVFTANEGGRLPEGVVDGEAVQAPLVAKMKRDTNAISVFLAEDGYEVRSITILPTAAKMNLRVPLLPEGAGDIAVIWVDDTEGSENAEIEMTEDTDIEMKALIYSSQAELKKCMQTMNSETLMLLLDSQSRVTVPDGTNECMMPFVEKIQEARTNGALPELSDLIDVRVVIAIP